MAPKIILKAVILSVLVTAVLSETFQFDAARGTLVPGQKNCTENGIAICSDCKTVSMCYQMADGNFFSNNMTSCGDGETCSSSKLQCTKDSNPECDGATSQNDFICYALGIFPDPYKCTIYHMCVPDATGVKPNPKSVIIPCPTGFAFDPVTSTCRINMTALGGQCTPAVPMKCVNDTKGPIVQDPSIYYWCMKNPAGQFYPVMFRCTKNQQFIDGICRDLPLAPPLTGTCTKKLRYFDPNDCKAYFDCPGPNYRPFRVQCPSYRRFVFQEQNCVDFSCAPTATNTGVCKL